MNTYFPEGGFSSHKSLECWYNCHGNIERKPVPTTHAEAAAMQSVMEEELALRGIHYHCVGHGWHMDPFGIDFNDYEFGKYEIPEGYPIQFQRGNRSFRYRSQQLPDLHDIRLPLLSRRQRSRR